MQSTFGGLNTVVRGLYAQQTSLNTVGHNISNANTDGYSRQSVNLVTTSPETVYGSAGNLQMGTGVDVQSITRARDTFTDRQMWKENSTLGQGQTLEDTLGKIEGIFQEPTDSGLQDVLNKFWSACQSVSTNASDNGTRVALRERAVEVVDAIQHYGTQLKDMTSDINSVLSLRVDKINQITSEIASINKQVATVEAGGTDHANDLRDRRDSLVDQLSKMVNVRVSEDKYGNYTVQSAGQVLVDGNGYTELQVNKDTVDQTFGYVKYQIQTKDNPPIQLQFTDGEVKGLLDSRDDSEFGINGYLQKLDKVSEFLLKDFNEVQKQGYGLDEQSGRNFFGESGIDYSTWNPTNPSPGQGTYLSQLKVNPAIMADNITGPGLIAAKTLATVTRSNASGGMTQVYGSYTGTENQKYEVKIAGVDLSGRVTQIQYSINGVDKGTLSAGTGTDPYEFSIDGMKLKLDNNASNQVDDTYTFTPLQGDAAGDNAVRLSEALKSDIHNLLGSTYKSVLGNMSLDSYWNAATGALGVQKQNATRLADNQKSLVDQITSWRESVSGVNMDEEMTNMIKFQKGYSAAARVITTIDEMLDKLINSTGTVGR